MTTLNQQHHHLHLAGGALASGQFERSRLLLVRRGYVWITQEGRGEDFWLSAGDSIILLPGQLVVVEAMLASEIYLENRAELSICLWLRAGWFAARGLMQRTLARVGLGSHVLRHGGY